MSKLNKFGIFCVAILGLILMFYGAENLRGKSAWENFKKEWEAKGEVFDYKHIIPKPIPSEKNFAHIPLLKPLHEYKWNKDLTESTPIDQKKFDQALGLMKIEELKGRSLPKLGQWNIGQPADLIAWQKFFREQKGWPHPEEAGKPAADILLALGKFEATMAKLTQAAKERPLCRYDIKYEAHFGALLPHLATYRNLARSFTLRALAHLGNDDPEAALSDIQMSLFVSESIKDEPLLISQLVRIACLQMSLQPLWEGLKEEKWNPEQLVIIENQLAKIDLLEGYRISLLGERDFANLMIDQMRDNPKSAGMLLENDGTIPGYWLIPQGWIYQNQRRLNEMHVKFSQRIIDPKARRIHPDIAVTFATEVQARSSRSFPIFDVLSSMLLPAIEKVAIKIGSSQTAVDHARIACLLELHKLEHNKYPAQLADLKTPFPNDPYTGKPHVYKPDPKGRYQLYGVGWNQKDDGGKVVFASPKGNLDREKGDLVWQYTTVLPPKKNK